MLALAWQITTAELKILSYHGPIAIPFLPAGGSMVRLRDLPSRPEPQENIGSCTLILRIIRSAQKPV
jgi:hypothetical protein